MHSSSDQKIDWVILVRLDSTFGFQSMGDVMSLVAALQAQGISAIGEKAPGAPLDILEVFYIKVPVEQRAEAGKKLKTVLAREPFSIVASED